MEKRKAEKRKNGEKDKGRAKKRKNGKKERERGLKNQIINLLVNIKI